MSSVAGECIATKKRPQTDVSGSDERGKQSNPNLFSKNDETFKSLLNKIKNVIVSKKYTWTQKIKRIINVSVEWCLSHFLHIITNTTIFEILFHTFVNSKNG